MRTGDIRTIKVVCRHPSKPYLRTRRFPQKLELAWDRDRWSWLNPACSYQWKCPDCRLDLPLKQEKLAWLIWHLDLISSGTARPIGGCANEDLLKEFNALDDEQKRRVAITLANDERPEVRKALRIALTWVEMYSTQLSTARRWATELDIGRAQLVLRCRSQEELMPRLTGVYNPAA